MIVDLWRGNRGLSFSFDDLSSLVEYVFGEFWSYLDGVLISGDDEGVWKSRYRFVMNKYRFYS